MAYALWLALFHSNTKVLVISQKEDDAFELIKKARFILNHLPDWMKEIPDGDSKSELVFKSRNSEIKSLPSTDNAGKGYNASLVIRDELSEHPKGKDNYDSISPSIDSGGSLIDLSTILKNSPNNHFTNRCEEIRNRGTVTEYESKLQICSNPDTVAKLVFIPWDARPVRDEGMSLQDWWDSRIVPKYYYNTIGREQNYPKSIDEALKPSTIKMFFENQALDEMQYQLMPPIVQSEINTFNGQVRVYKPPVAGRKYVGFTDPSDGVEDPYVTGIADYITKEIVCTSTGKERIDVCAKIHDYLVRIYNNCPNSFEYTGVGTGFAMTLKQLGTPNLAPRRDVEGKIQEGKLGQWVSIQHNKKNLNDLAFEIAKRQLVVHDKEFFQQAKFVNRDGDSPIMERGLSFDWVMMMAGLVQLLKNVPRTEFGVRAVRYRG
jgi:hypothetical protein